MFTGGEKYKSGFCFAQILLRPERLMQSVLQIQIWFCKHLTNTNPTNLTNTNLSLAQILLRPERLMQQFVFACFPTDAHMHFQIKCIMKES